MMEVFTLIKVFFLTVFFMLMLFLSGCSSTKYIPTIVEKEVYVPYIPNLPEIECNFKGNNQEDILKNLVECIALHKRILESLKVKSTEKSNEFNIAK